MEQYKNEMRHLVDKVETALRAFLPESGALHATIYDAMRYSLLAGGKRIRPVIVLSFAKAFGVEESRAMPYACALEMIHTYSLIHDDLPCMDNDDLRRGRPTNHKVYGDGVATLAGDALLNRAFELSLKAMMEGDIPLQNAGMAIRLMADCAGADGMIGGQIIDLEAEGKSLALSQLETLQQMKTGALFVASAKMGTLLAGAPKEAQAAAERFAQKLGLAFQIRDDILDVEGDVKELGKATGHDAETNKSTFVSVFGLEESKRRVQALTKEAIDALESIPNHDFLLYIAEIMGGRTK